MRALYDSQADAIAIDLVEEEALNAEEGGDRVAGRCVVARGAGGRAVSVELLYPSLGIEGPLAAAAERYGLDREALEAAARSAVAAPDRVVVLEVLARAAA